MKKLLVKILLILSVCSIGLVACSKEVKKDNSVDDATRKSAKEAVRELEQQ